MQAPRSNQTPLHLSARRRGLATQAAADAGATVPRMARENRVAVLSQDDQRAVFAAHVARQLEGGTAAILPPDRRQRLIQIARQLGLGAFDANLVIAIVQDAVREGDDPLGIGTDQRLSLVRAPRPVVESARTLLVWWAGAMLLGAAFLAGLIAWTLH